MLLDIKISYCKILHKLQEAASNFAITDKKQEQ